MDSDLIPIEQPVKADDPLVTLPLSKLQWIRDQLGRIRWDSPLHREVWRQISSLYAEKEQEAIARKPS